MFQIDSITSPELILQYAAMILVTIMLGYMIGYVGSKQTKEKLETKLVKLNLDLENCRSKKDFGYNSLHEHDNDQMTDQHDLHGEVKTENLKIITGISTDIEEKLHAAGIFNFRQLSSVNGSQITAMLLSAGFELQTHDPRTWPQQAQLADSGMWEALKELQNELNKNQRL